MSHGFLICFGMYSVKWSNLELDYLKSKRLLLYNIWSGMDPTIPLIVPARFIFLFFGKIIQDFLVLSMVESSKSIKDFSLIDGKLSQISAAVSPACYFFYL